MMSIEPFMIQIGCILLTLMILIKCARESSFGFDRRGQTRLGYSLLIISALSLAYIFLTESEGYEDVFRPMLIVLSVAASVSGVLWISVIDGYTENGITKPIKINMIALTLICGVCCMLADVSDGRFMSTVSFASAIPYAVLFLVSLNGAIRAGMCWERQIHVSVSLLAIPAIVCLALMGLMQNANLIGICAILSFFALQIYGDYRESVLDSLTGIYNEDAIAKYISTNLAKGKSVCVALFQIGGNHVVNNVYGHVEGDRVLKDTADCMKKASVGKKLFIGHFVNSKYYAVSLEGEDILREFCDNMLPLIENINANRPYRLSPLAGIVKLDAFESLTEISKAAKQNLIYNYRDDA